MKATSGTGIISLNSLEALISYTFESRAHAIGCGGYTSDYNSEQDTTSREFSGSITPGDDMCVLPYLTNNDSREDAAYYLRYLISDGLYDFADWQLPRADMNNDKKYDMLDVIKILQTAESNNT